MTTPTVKNFTLVQGDTFDKDVHWEVEPVVFKAITGITQAAPVVLTVPTHGLVSGWRTAVVSVKTMIELNALKDPPKDPSDYHQMKVNDPSTIELVGVDSSLYTAYGAGGGYLRYNTPKDLAGYTARMSIKDKVGGTEILRLTDVNGGIVIDNVAKTIKILMTATQTAAITKACVYDLEMVNGTVVTKIVRGKLSLMPEVTL